MDPDTERGRVLVEESREAVIVLDDSDTVVLASRRARQSIEGIEEGEKVPDGLLSGDLGIVPLIVPYEVGARRERIVYLSQPGDMTAYEELRTGFTAAVSHELRTPLARLLSLLEMATLARRGHPRARRPRARRGRVGPRADRRGALPLRARVGRSRRLARAGRRAARARHRGRRARGALVAGRRRAARRRRRGDHARDASADAPGRGPEPGRERDPLRRAGHRASRSRSSATATPSSCAGADDGVGVNEEELSRLFERFYRADHARASRGTGLGLAIVKHIVGQAGGAVEARGGKGAGLEIRCVFPARS